MNKGLFILLGLAVFYIAHRSSMSGLTTATQTPVWSGLPLPSQAPPSQQLNSGYYNVSGQWVPLAAPAQVQGLVDLGIPGKTPPPTDALDLFQPDGFNVTLKPLP
jgi:hypothetical protein